MISKEGGNSVEYALCVIVGVLVGYLLAANPRKAKSPITAPTDEEVLRAQKALREYKNFMTYDGFSSQGEENE